MLISLLKTMRPKQWAKNVFVFAALVFDQQMLQPEPLLRTLAGFVILCMVSSTVYLINDLADIEKDRQHPQKRNRPLASGRLARPPAIAAAILLPAIALPLAYALDWRFGLLCTVFLVKDLLYSFWLKHVVIIDVMVLALGFVLRVGAGVTLITVARFSPWLYICMTLLALLIGFGKRRAELVLMVQKNNASRAVLSEYSVPFLDEVITMISMATVMAYSFYTFSAENLPKNHTMMLTIPFVLYAILRYLYLIHLKGEGGAPEDLIFTDRPLQVTFALWGLCAVLVLYLSR
jgi:4-hydroxybenzoate polyprenyltransferase